MIHKQACIIKRIELNVRAGFTPAQNNEPTVFIDRQLNSNESKTQSNDGATARVARTSYNFGKIWHRNYYEHINRDENLIEPFRNTSLIIHPKGQIINFIWNEIYKSLHCYICTIVFQIGCIYNLKSN